MALALDLTIRLRSQNKKSLDDVMRHLWNVYGRDFYQGHPKGLDERGFARAVSQATGVDVQEEVAVWTERTDDLPLETLFASQGIQMNWKATKSHPVLDVRLKAGSEGCIISNVIEGGAAHKGGLSAHDVILAIGGLRVDHKPAGVDTVLAHHLAGETVPIHVFRRDELRCFDVTLAAPAAAECHLEPVSAP